MNGSRVPHIGPDVVSDGSRVKAHGSGRCAADAGPARVDRGEGLSGVPTWGRRAGGVGGEADPVRCKTVRFMRLSRRALALASLGSSSSEKLDLEVRREVRREARPNGDVA